MLVKIGIVATVTVGGMDAVVEPSGTSLWRVTGGNNDNECCTTDNKVILLWGNSLLAERTARGIVRIGIVATVTFGDMSPSSLYGYIHGVSLGK
ncbi:hypothetical protein [Shewanella baltica]|uniref:hypothetical protein n=1 Tax=Shewanella baltica TaxID=62322 RepID=UPI00217E5CAD|nr:hypothetical protein [Shewanella baltica]